MPPNSTPPPAADSEEEDCAEATAEEGPDPAKEILATIGSDNPEKYLVASQVFDAMMGCGSSWYGDAVVWCRLPPTSLLLQKQRPLHPHVCARQPSTGLTLCSQSAIRCYRPI